ncbi:hypothetical protein C8Q80DRAFT_1201351 [Daedaleopsis nitida]|nr:hypothetical protein C8Q80DRAFT_1201351 [Daedaleopsis nitida]
MLYKTLLLMLLTLILQSTHWQTQPPTQVQGEYLLSHTWRKSQTKAIALARISRNSTTSPRSSWITRFWTTPMCSQVMNL